MPNTTNFNWVTPADTDLVKDGAAAIRTLGNGIDTSLVDLKGGTTGQVLSKATNTDLDYTWITPNVGDITEVQAGTGISIASGTGPIPVVTNTVATAFDAAGDLVYGTGADTFTKLSLGTAGQILKVNSGATAPEWGAASAAADSFTLINSGGTSLSGSSVSITGISGKNDLAIYIDELSLAGSGDIGIRIQINSDTGTNYWNGVVGRRTSSVFSEAFESATGWYLGAPNASGDTMFIQARISGCNGSGYKFGWWVSSQNGANANNATYVNGQGNWSGSGTISSIQIKCDSSTFDGGTVYVYGA